MPQQLRPFGTSLYVADGPEVSFFGFPYPTRMAVAVLPSGALWVWSPIALTASLKAEVRALGEPRFLVEPNKLHHLALDAWVEAFPAARLYAPPGLASKRDDLRFDETLGTEAPAPWEGQIELVPIEGSFAMTEVLFFHRPSRTCLVGDLVQRHDPEAMTAWRRWVMKADGLTGPEGSTPREWRLTFTDRAKARAALERALAWAPERLLIAHGACAEKAGADVLRRSLSWLRPSTDA
ncbi:MAG: DUF4336 domain-containing protein [Myxococcales bacterium]|nr:DUF4336 domain-containing protein [Myxococcales bacterium]